MTCISFLGYLYSEGSEEHISDLRKQAKSDFDFESFMTEVPVI